MKQSLPARLRLKRLQRELELLTGGIRLARLALLYRDRNMSILGLDMEFESIKADIAAMKAKRVELSKKRDLVRQRHGDMSKKYDAVLAAMDKEIAAMEAQLGGLSNFPVDDQDTKQGTDQTQKTPTADAVVIGTASSTVTADTTQQDPTTVRDTTAKSGGL